MSSSTTTTTTTVQPLDRQDVHKSCRAIEALLAVLSDYSDAAAALAAAQKKLARALKDVAALKTNAQFAANAFGASCSVLEALADIDAKFAKLADKESQAISADVKKWFKKLSKLERAHDERMNESNARIKQAGQAYEKKSKKGAKDAGEEHARYIHLLSVVGPEMSQEKFNHALHVTQQNTFVSFNLAAAFARIADAEWSRTCESIRRISPTIGSVGEWRAFCEAACSHPLPDDLPDSVTSDLQPNPVSEWGLSTPLRRTLPVPPVAGHSPGSLAASSLDPPRSPFAVQSQNQGSVNSITTLSAFPFPPTHFPVPLAANEADLLRQQTLLQNLHSAHSRATSPISAPPVPVLTDSPKQASPELDPKPFLSQVPSHDPRDLITESLPDPKGTIKPLVSVTDQKKPRRLSLIARVPSPSARPASPFKRVLVENEFGVDSSASSFKSHSVDDAKKHLERTDSTLSSGNNVAALRDRYTRPIETPFQGPKDIPRLPMSVFEIASRYQSDEPMSPRYAASPSVDHFPSDTPTRRELLLDDNEIRRRKQRIEELTELELKEKELELRQRERDLERDRRHFVHARPDTANAADGPKGPRNSPFTHKRASQSVTHVNLPSTASSSGMSARPSTSHSSQPLPTKDHAPFCGCDSCSVSKYKATQVPPSPRDLRPPEPPILLRPEKPKGWIRRLSMPSVNVAFSLDAKKNASAVSLKSGLPLPAENGRIRKRSYEQGISNRTLNALGR